MPKNFLMSKAVDQVLDIWSGRGRKPREFASRWRKRRYFLRAYRLAVSIAAALRTFLKRLKTHVHRGIICGRGDSLPCLRAYFSGA